MGSEVLAYADDLVIKVTGKAQLTRILRFVEEWSEANNMQVNKSKSALLKLKLKKSLNEPTTVNGYPIVDEYKYLGVKIESTGKTKNNVAARVKIK